MRIFVDTFLVPKGGNPIDEWEDSYSPELNDEQEAERFRFAVADGASSGLLSGEWAQVLTETFCGSDLAAADIAGFLKKATAQWEIWLQEYLRSREEQNKPIKWYEEPGLSTGAFATVLGMEMNEDEASGKWQAVAVGDSCLFHVRQDELITCFPIDHSSRFDNNPALLCSNPARNDGLDEKIAGIAGEWQFDDEFYLMTDSMAQWFLSDFELGQRPWRVLRDLNTRDQEQSIEELVVKLRKAQAMRNDDVTLLRITIT